MLPCSKYLFRKLHFFIILLLQFSDTFCGVFLLQVNATMRAVCACLILLVVTAHMSVAKILTPCQLLGELKKHNVAGNDLATCELNSWRRLLNLFHRKQSTECHTKLPIICSLKDKNNFIPVNTTKFSRWNFCLRWHVSAWVSYFQVLF
jgi:hypothetical protein